MASRSGRRGVLVKPEEREMFVKQLEELERSPSPLSNSPSSDASRELNKSAGNATAESVAAADRSPMQNKSSSKPSPNVGNIDPSATANANQGPTHDEGCRACGRDDDHTNLMLCEGCNSEYHFYCLDPPLPALPTEDWFCDKCKPESKTKIDDGLEQLVLALPPPFTSRFGEVVWAQGGVGFGWWPSCIYDPRLTVGSARELARKYLGKKHLVYFFECQSAPFSVLADPKLTPWEKGLAEDYHLGRAAHSTGKTRGLQFRQALQVAILEFGKPVDLRMEWNHASSNIDIPSQSSLPQSQPPSMPSKKRGRKKPTQDMEGDPKGGLRKKRSSKTKTYSDSEASTARPVPCPASRDNLLQAVAALTSSANRIESLGDSDLYCKVFKICIDSTHGHVDENLGFIRFASRRTATFADARAAMVQDLDSECLPERSKWKFYLPSLGPMSAKQELTLGPIVDLLQAGFDQLLGDGSISNPLQLLIVDAQARHLSPAKLKLPQSNPVEFW